MKNNVTLTILALSFVLCAAQFTFAQDKTIDDFTTGAYQSKPLTRGLDHSVLTGDPNHLLGGSRDTQMLVCDPKVKGQCAAVNPYNQPNSYGFFPATSGRVASMVQTGGYYAGPRIDMGYGFQNPMDINFGAYQKIRINFSGLSQGLNFNILLYSGGPYAIGGCNMGTFAGAFSAELPLSLFQQAEGFDLSHVTNVDVIFQDGSAVGNVGFGVTSIELSNTTKSGVVIDCHY